MGQGGAACDMPRLSTQEKCRFVLVERPARVRFPAVNRFTDKQAIASAHRWEPFDHGLRPITAANAKAIGCIMLCSPDRKIFP
jgi:hypothetical protein